MRKESRGNKFWKRTGAGICLTAALLFGMWLGACQKTDFVAEETKLMAAEQAAPDLERIPDQPLPAAYDMRKAGYRPDVPDQGELGTCWAFASLLALESSLRPEERIPLSADHMSIRNSFGLDQNAGGDYMMAAAYLLAWQGPVAEEEDPYGDGKSPEGLAPVCHVQEIRLIEKRDFEWIKRAVLKYGGVQTSLYVPEDQTRLPNTYYREDTGAYYCDRPKEANHDVVVIGWDDAYSRENFKKRPNRDGAFLCINSWGEQFGDDGCFYVSYEDGGFGSYCVSYSGVEDVDNYGQIYQTDLCGWTGNLGYGGETAWFANVYEARDDETLRAAGLYATRPGASYRLYAARQLPPASDSERLKRGLARRDLLAEGILPEAGYYTIRFTGGIRLKEGERFAVVAELKTPGESQPVAVEYQGESGKTGIDIMDGEGYISFNGSLWERAEETEECNICLKVYTSVD